MPKLSVFKITTTVYAKDEEEAWEQWDEAIDPTSNFAIDMGIQEDGDVYLCGICDEEIPEHEYEAYGGWCSTCTALHKAGMA